MAPKKQKNLNIKENNKRKKAHRRRRRPSDNKNVTQVQVAPKKKLSPKARKAKARRKRRRFFFTTLILSLLIFIVARATINFLNPSDTMPEENISNVNSSVVIEPTADNDASDAGDILQNEEISGGISGDEQENMQDNIQDEDEATETVSPSPSATPTPEPEKSPEPTATPEPTPKALIGVKPEANEFCTLVNADNALDKNYKVNTTTIKGTQKMFDTRAASALEKMLEDASAAGYPMYLVSTHRSISYQDGLYQKKVNEFLANGYNRPKAEAEAARWVAPPGTSEHNLGLAADIVSSTWYAENNDLEQSFEETDHFYWLYENCANYGFILRYPKNAESITGITYEPWHYRYVGVEVACFIMNNQLTLEEFLLL